MDIIYFNIILIVYDIDDIIYKILYVKFYFIIYYYNILSF